MVNVGKMSESLSRRLRPLYIAAFLQSFVLWYAVEKLFMTSIGFSSAGIGVMVAVYSAAMLLVDIPSGILADRWSRKGVLMFASFILILSAITGGLSHSVGMYLLSAVLWGMFYACYSGMYESIVYDTLLEENQPEALYGKVYGRIQIADSLGLIVSSLIGGFLGSQLTLRAPYFVSVVPALAAIVSLCLFREPKLHRKSKNAQVFTQLRETFRAITRNTRAVPVVVSLVLKSTVLFLFFEFDQLWLIALHTPTAYYGPINAILLASIGLGGWAAQHVRLDRRKHASLLLLALFASAFTLTVSHNIPIVVTAQTVAATSLVVLAIRLMNQLHGMLPSRLRASAVSATSTLGRMLVIPIALLFGYVSEHASVFSATYILLILGCLMSYFVWRSLRSVKRAE